MKLEYKKNVFVLFMLVASDGPLASYSLLMSLPHYQIRIIVDVYVKKFIVQLCSPIHYTVSFTLSDPK